MYKVGPLTKIYARRRDLAVETICVRGGQQWCLFQTKAEAKRLVSG